MRLGTRHAALLLGCALMITVAACGSDGGGWAQVKAGRSGSTARGVAAPRNAGPPPGGWPQPENGRLTERMCGLLTDADYAKFGHQRLPLDSAKRSETGINAVYCLYMTGDELTINLQPTAQSAKLVFAAHLREHREHMAAEERQTIFATSVVPGADESWFDYSSAGTDNSPYKETQLELRRGSLLVEITLSGIKGKTEAAPRTVLSGLAALVLQRIPNVGKTDTGRTHLVVYQVSGSGRASTLSYTDPTKARGITRKNVPLPWRIAIPMGETDQLEIPLTLSAASTAPLAPLGCRVTVDGKIISVQPRELGGVTCLGSYRPKGS